MLLYGKHAALAALNNPARRIKRVLMTANAQSGLKLPSRASGLRTEIMQPQQLEKLLPKEAVHQGIAVEVEKLAPVALEDVLHLARPLLLLDQVSDPHNVGAILRSAAAFDAAAVIVTAHGAPEENAVMAKAASGALDIVPLVQVVNLAQAMERIKKSGYWVVGLDGDAKQTLRQAKMDFKTTALVLGAEGRGLRRLTGERCDLLVRLPIAERMESLNVSNAAAVALYELAQSMPA